MKCENLDQLNFIIRLIYNNTNLSRKQSWKINVLCRLGFLVNKLLSLDHSLLRIIQKRNSNLFGISLGNFFTQMLVFLVWAFWLTMLELLFSRQSFATVHRDSRCVELFREPAIIGSNKTKLYHWLLPCPDQRLIRQTIACKCLFAPFECQRKPFGYMLDRLLVGIKRI